MTEKNRNNKFMTVRGILVAVDWDDLGNTLAVSIMGMDEEEHIVEQNGKGKELTGFIRHEIKARGMVRELVSGHKMIRVKDYALNGSDD